MDSPTPPRICFLLGIDQRSGTNFLFNLIATHPECVGPGPIWEDCFVRDAGRLRRFADDLYRQWNDAWEVERTLGGPEALTACLGDGIEAFLRRQLPGRAARDPKSEGDAPTPRVLLTKSPSFVGLDYFCDLFPRAYLVLVVRDGRAVVESGVRSFDWDFEQAAYRWRDGADRLLRFERNAQKDRANDPCPPVSSGDHSIGQSAEAIEDQGALDAMRRGGEYLVVRYEELVADRRGVLRRIFEYLGVDPDGCGEHELQSVGAIGSSELRERSGEVYWKGGGETVDGFNPLERFRDWPAARHERFAWIAGPQMRALGYETAPIPPGRLRQLKHRLTDGRTATKTFFQKGRRALTLGRKLINDRRRQATQPDLTD
ncbi:MAG: sulfotransferase [Planctomycetota bacterium]